VVYSLPGMKCVKGFSPGGGVWGAWFTDCVVNFLGVLQNLILGARSTNLFLVSP
jgi:hypothetical protein